MKGIIKRDEKGWKVLYTQCHPKIMVKEYNKSIPLHPDDAKTCKQYGDYSVDWQGKKIEFEIVTEWENDEVGVNGLTYAKLINNIPDVVEDDFEKLVISEWNEYEERTGNPPYMYHIGFTEGYLNAKESLYTEEQVRKAYEYGSNASLGVSKTNLIQSLKK